MSPPLYCLHKKSTYHEAIDETEAAVTDGSGGEFFTTEMSGEDTCRYTHSAVDYIDKYSWKC